MRILSALTTNAPNAYAFLSRFRLSKPSYWLTLMLLGALQIPTAAMGADIGDPVPSCSASGIEYSITNLLPSNYCFFAGANITATFDVNLSQPQTGYNVAIGYTAAGDSTLRDITCLSSGIDLDGAGCSDYDGSGTAGSPVTYSATVNVSCGLPASNQQAPLDLYLNYDTTPGGSNAEVTAPTCRLQTGVSVPFRAVGIQVTANITNDDGGTANPSNWTITGNIAGGPVEFTGNGFFAGNGFTFAGDYELIGTGPTGYTLEDVTCRGATYNPVTSSITVLPGDRAVCVMLYNDIGVVVLPEPFLTLNKTIVNDDGGTAVVDDFGLSIDGVGVVAGVATQVASGTGIDISELDLADYTEGTWSCVDNAGITTGLPTNGLATGTTLLLEPGSNVDCKIENNDTAKSLDIDLAINKSVSNTSPSIGDVISFSLTVSNSGPDDATDVSVTDILPAGFAYVAGSIAGAGVMSDTSPSGSGLQWTIALVASGSATTLSYDVTTLAP